MVLDTQQFIDWLTGVGMDADEARSFVDALNEDRAELLTVAEFNAAMSGLRGEMAQHRGETREQLATPCVSGPRACTPNPPNFELKAASNTPKR